jgi:hypothetical protein
MKSYTFNKSEVFILRHSKRDQQALWEEFIKLAKAFGIKVTATGGNFLAHKALGADESDFNLLLEILA